MTCTLLTALLAGSIAGCGMADTVGGADSTAEARGEAMGAAVGSSGTGSGEDKDTEAVGSGKEAGDSPAASGTEPAGDSANADTAAIAVTDFGLRLLQGCAAEKDAFPPQASMPLDIYAQTGIGENILVSPLSVITALAMTANGAKGETKAQMEKVFGMPVPELSAYLSDYSKKLPEAEEYKLSMANGIWFTEDERFTVEQAFIQENEDTFGAGVHRVPFDESAVKEINGWVRENTDGMIEEILDQIPPDAVMCLVNALAFDARWQEIYFENQVREGEFTQEDGSIKQVELMYSMENAYLEDGHGTGFLKYYADRKYAFAALLPEEGMALSDYLASLDGAKLHEMLKNPVNAVVDAAIPKYESEYGIEMKNVLQSMGMTDAFDEERADLSGIGSSVNGQLYISKVLHKTFVAVDETGTKAGAATAVEMEDGGVAIEPQEIKTVYLDRPFLYMIIDCESGIPVFIGTVETVESFLPGEQ